MGVKSYTHEDLVAILNEARSSMHLHIEFERVLAGSQPADDKGLTDFIKHQLGINPDTNPREFNECLARIRNEEIKETDITPAHGEVHEEKVYGVIVFRRSDHGPFILDHQIKALLKAACTRMGVFEKPKGSKGDIVEMSAIVATGASLRNPARPWEVYITDAEGKPATTHFEIVRGTITGASGQKLSIVHHTEFAPEGSHLDFIVKWAHRKFTADLWPKVIAAAMQIGLGAIKNRQYGRFRVLKMEVED